MDTDLSKNTLIGTLSADTLANLSAVVMLLKSLSFNGEINKNAEYGLFLIYTLIQDSLEYEIKRIDPEENTVPNPS